MGVNDIVTSGGLKIGIGLQAAEELIDGKPQIEGNTYKYSYETYVRYEKPRRPQGDKGFTYVGEYRYGIIKLTISENRIVKYYIWASREPDW